MADYIYLLQHRLTVNQRHALQAVRDTARGLGFPIFLVGGAVRDLTSGAPVRDLDFAMQGDVEGLLQGLASAGSHQTGENKGLQSRYFVFPGGVRVEVGPTVSVKYPQPGIPEAVSAPILDDLRRRDFTANAMAISLNEGSYGLLLDPMNGVADLENRELRLVSNVGFIEQPALLLRAARLSNRLGWNFEERTQRRYENAKEEGAIDRLSAEAKGYELEEIFHEEDPVSALEHLAAEGWLAHLSTTLGGLKPDQEGLDRVRDTLGQMEQIGIFADPSAVYFPLLTVKLAAAAMSEIKSAFARPGFSEQIESLDARSRELAAQLTAKASALPSATWKLLFRAEPEVVLALASSSRTGAAQAKFKAFFGDWPQARQRIPYALMQEMRISPELPGYEQLLEDLFFAIIDNKLSSPEETRAFLEPFSPPAPAQQVAPRRRAAKSARGRGRPAVAAKTMDSDLDDDDIDSRSSSRGEPDDDVDDEEDMSPSRPDEAKEEEDDADDDETETPAAPLRPPLKTAGTKAATVSESSAVPVSAAPSKKPTETSQPVIVKVPLKSALPAASDAKTPAAIKENMPQGAALKQATSTAVKKTTSVPVKVVAKPASIPVKAAVKAASSKIAAKSSKSGAKNLATDVKGETNVSHSSPRTIPGKPVIAVAKPVIAVAKKTPAKAAKTSTTKGSAK